MESINVVIDDSTPVMKDVEPDVGTSFEVLNETDNDALAEEAEVNKDNKSPSIRIQKMHPKELIIGDPRKGVTIRSRENVINSSFVSKIEPKHMKEALTDEF